MPPRTPRENFTHSIDRVLSLRELYTALTPRRGRPEEDKSDILRGAVVLCAAALDEVALTSIVEAMPKAALKGLLGPLAQKWVRSDPESILRALATGSPHAEVARIARTNLGEVTFQRAAAIEGVLQEALSCSQPWTDSAAALTSDTGRACTEGEVKAALDRFIERRNRIAHDGDRLPNRNALRSISQRYVGDNALLVLDVGLAVISVIEAHLSS